MGKVFDHITEEHRQVIAAQKIFFVATAPLSADGHINLSPKGMDTFRVLNSDTVAYLDLTGSGNETSAHLLENGRITFLFCAFEGRPLILRLYGQGRTILPGSGEWDEYIGLFPSLPGTRQIVLAEIERVSTSCGYGVPLMGYQGDRPQLTDWATKKGPEALAEYRREHNRRSLDGLPTALGATTAE
ncbi:MAG: pyridoxamine 5'-phosphate oxidase family protein [Anaerolinea sp.]|nr:pyridoxamine 5'-phosphate oxidase family protein [Anaerolinea sp.]